MFTENFNTHFFLYYSNKIILNNYAVKFCIIHTQTHTLITTSKQEFNFCTERAHLNYG